MNRAFEVLDQFAARLAIPDLWQQDAIRALGSGSDVIVDAPTGAGKTFIFESLAASRAFGPQRQAVYTVPTRALANDKWREWRAAGWQVGIATGDLAENLEAPVIVATLETQRERFLAGEGPRLLVIDEYQMIADERRGLNYELAVALAPPGTQLLLLSGSVANPGEVAAWMRRLGRRVEVVETASRPVPLDDIPWGALPEQAPRRVKNHWQRLAMAALLSDCGPLLIFAPQRRAAEKIARKIAEALPDDDPIELGDPALRRAAGPELARLLRKRIAWHHSGLTFAQRAGIIEPLAKAGQLRVVVATLGLAAGINFSVRSVHVGDTRYQDGPFQREVRPDELLQMFGRAGRRGLDECGYAITSDRGPRLMDASPRQLRRASEIDWPTLLRVMRQAVLRGESPFAAARSLSERLFSPRRVRLGFSPVEGGAAGADSPAPSGQGASALFGLGRVRAEIRDAEGNWHPEKPGASGSAPLAGAWVWEKGRALPAVSSPAQIRALLPAGARLCRLPALPDGPARRYGAEFAVATRQPGGPEDAPRYDLTRQARAWAGGQASRAGFSRVEVEVLASASLAGRLGEARLCGFAERGHSLAALAALDSLPVPVVTDPTGRAWAAPERRSVAVESDTRYTDEATGESRYSAAGSAARAWRELVLIDPSGAPTARGVIFSFFQRGEGLAVAAALEDASYPVEELVRHLANLRAGHRFGDSEGGSDRLAIACRLAYGPADHEGYLRLGLPLGYGEGAAEALEARLPGNRAAPRGASAAPRRAGDDLEAGPGDIERAWVEWLSLLRHTRGAPDYPWDRWRQLQAAASAELDRLPRASPLRDLPAIPGALLSRPARHRLSPRQIPAVTS